MTGSRKRIAMSREAWEKFDAVAETIISFMGRIVCQRAVRESRVDYVPVDIYTDEALKISLWAKDNGHAYTLQPI